MSILWVALLFLNHINFTDNHHHSFFVLTSALEYAVPIVANIPLSYFATKSGVRTVLTFSYLVIAVGLFSFVLCRASRLLYIFGVACFSLFWSTRIIRMSLVARLVSPNYRTTAIAGHQFMLACGTNLGPACWYLSQLWRGRFSFFGVVFDRFAVLFILNGLLQCAMSLTAYMYLPNSRPVERLAIQKPCVMSKKDSKNDEYESTAATSETLRFDSTSPRSFIRRRIAFFSAISFLARGSSGVYLVAVQPILADVFHTTDADMAKIMSIISCFAIVSPLVLAGLAKFLTDRYLLLFALSIQVIGMMLFLPISGTITRSQVVIGILMVIQSILVFTTVSVSLFSKLLGRLYEHSYIGYLWTSAMLGVAISQAASTRWIIPFFGHWSFAIFTLPAIIVMFTVRFPTIWCFLKT